MQPEAVDMETDKKSRQKKPHHTAEKLLHRIRSSLSTVIPA